MNRTLRILSISCAVGVAACCAQGAQNPIEAGAVRWGRDLDSALKQSGDTGRPVFLLFQEIPGCAGCKAFGRDVLSAPLLVEAIEDEFIPVLVYNNRKGGMDEKLRKRFREPAWNYQVIRFLNARGRDIIPRRGSDWTVGGVASRMTQALVAAGRPVPTYLKMLAWENNTKNHGVCALAMSCFWTGELRLGQIEGVVSTEAGWVEGREVTRVVYRKNVLTLEQLAKQAATLRCAQKVYAPGKEAALREDLPTGQLDARYRKAKPSDQKKQLVQWQAIRRVPNLTPAQLTRLNAFARSDRARALELLSPRQLQALQKAE